MAGDWIPIRCNIHDDPAVIAIAAATGLDEYAVVGRMVKLWAWANQHTTDGNAPGVAEVWIDRYVSMPGFAAAMLSTGWLGTGEGVLTFPRFDRWNSEGAKRRVEKTRQKKAQRAGVSPECRQSVANSSPCGPHAVAQKKDVIPRPLRAAVLNRDGNRCCNCGWAPGAGPSPVGFPSQDRLSIDHILPESRGGQTVESNLVTLCVRCNQQKGSRTFSEAGMTPDLSHISGDKLATERRPEKRREEKRTEEVKTDPPTPRGGSEPVRPSPPAAPEPEPFDPLRHEQANRKQFEARWRDAGLRPFSRLDKSLWGLLASLMADSWWAERYPAALERASQIPFLRDGANRQRGALDVSEFLRDPDLCRKILDGMYDPRPIGGAPDPRAPPGGSLTQKAAAAFQTFLANAPPDEQPP